MGDNKFTINREKREIIIERTFDAPRALVWKVWTDPSLIPKWWGPGYLATAVEKMDVKPGGAWRFIQRGTDGSEYAFNGVYREIVPPAKIVSTFEFEGMPGHLLLETITFEERNGKTKLTNTVSFQIIEDLDEMVNSGMEAGAFEGLDRLCELLSEL
jgi:uncharacterized protein YndB with AHSA1/START domain